MGASKCFRNASCLLLWGFDICRTRAVFVDFSVYNGAEDITTMISLMVEFPLSGALNTTYDIQTHKMLRFIHGKVDPYMVCEVRQANRNFSSLLITIWSEILAILWWNSKWLGFPWNMSLWNKSRCTYSKVLPPTITFSISAACPHNVTLSWRVSGFVVNFMMIKWYLVTLADKNSCVW